MSSETEGPEKQRSQEIDRLLREVSHGVMSVVVDVSPIASPSTTSRSLAWSTLVLSWSMRTPILFSSSLAGYLLTNRMKSD